MPIASIERWGPSKFVKNCNIDWFELSQLGLEMSHFLAFWLPCLVVVDQFCLFAVISVVNCMMGIDDCCSRFSGLLFAKWEYTYRYSRNKWSRCVFLCVFFPTLSLSSCSSIAFMVSFGLQAVPLDDGLARLCDHVLPVFGLRRARAVLACIKPTTGIEERKKSVLVL